MRFRVECSCRIEHEHYQAASSVSLGKGFLDLLRTTAVGRPSRCKRRSWFHSLMISRSFLASMAATRAAQ